MPVTLPFVFVVVGVVVTALQTVIVTVEPFGSDAPPPGVWLMTLPLVAGEHDVLVLGTGLKPALESVAFAAVSDLPVTVGTVTGHGPVEISRFTALLGVTFTLGAGV